MNKDNKVAVVSTMNARVSITLPELRLNKEWPKKGTKILLDKDKLEEALYDEGVKYMFDQGILYIEDMKDKIDLGLEPEEATEPQNIIVLNEGQMLRYLKVATIKEMESILEKLTHEQLINFAQYAISIELGDRDKCALLQKYSGINVNKTIELERTPITDK